MKKYKGLFVPERIPDTNDHLITEIQRDYCVRTPDCPISCSVCLYDYGNLSKFKEWYKSKKQSTNQ